MLRSTRLVMPKISLICKVPCLLNLPPTHLCGLPLSSVSPYPQCTGSHLGTNKHLQNIYYVPAIFLSTLQILIYLIFMANLQCRYYNYSDFTDEETDREGSSNLSEVIALI